MRYRSMGRTGLLVSEICLGTMTFGSRTEMDEAHRILDTAFDSGVTFHDTSDAYPAGTKDIGGTEEIIGRWLAGRPRDQVIVATKCFVPTGPMPHQRGNSRQHILDAVDDSLRYSDIRLMPEDLDFCDQPWWQIPRPTDPAVAMR